MDFLWNEYGFRILKDMDFGMDMDMVSNPSGSIALNSFGATLVSDEWKVARVSRL